MGGKKSKGEVRQQVMLCGGMWCGTVRTHVLAFLLIMSLPAPAMNVCIPGTAMPAPFAAARGWGRAGVCGPAMSGEVDTECGCLLESSCPHGAAAVASVRHRLLELECRPDGMTEEIAFIRSMMFHGADAVAVERAGVVRSTCVREGLARKSLSRGRLAARMARSNSTSAFDELSFRMAGRSLSVIAKRSARSWTPAGVRSIRHMCDINHNVLMHGDRVAYTHSSGSGDLPMMNKLVVPRLLSPSALGPATIRGELVSRLRGLAGRYEVAKSVKPFPLLMLRKDQLESEVSSAADEPVLAVDREVGNAVVFHAPKKAAPEVHEVPASDTWLEEGNTQDRVLPPIVAALLRRVAEEGDRAMEEDCEVVVATSKDSLRSAFHAQRRPKVSLADYAERMCKYGACSPGCLGLSLVYMDRFLRQTEGYRLTGLNVHRLLLSCVLVATKQWDDTHYNNGFWAKVGGVANAELNLLERHLLAKLDFSLLVDKSEWDAYRVALLAWGAVLEFGAMDLSAAAVAARKKLDTALASRHLRTSLIFEWSRDASAHTRGVESAANIMAATAPGGGPHTRHMYVYAGAAGYPAESPEGPGAANVLAADDDEKPTPAPASEDIYLAAQRQMLAGARVRGAADEPCAQQRLTGGATFCMQTAQATYMNLHAFAAAHEYAGAATAGGRSLQH